MNANEILEHFKQTGALLEGHFQLSSGLHSPMYLQCALALRDPRDAEKFASAIVEQLASEKFDLVASPAIGGIIIGYETARALGVPFLWTERENGAMTLRRGFSVWKDERVLVLEDVITTGGSTRECIAAIEKNGGSVIAAASIVDRSNGAADVGVKRIALVALDVPAFESASCPMCARGEKITKPGSRSVSSEK